MGNGAANKANAGATAAAQNAGNLSGTAQNLGSSLNNTLWGPSSSSSGGSTSGGALNNFLNPSNLNQSSLSGPYQLQYTNARNAGATTAANAVQNANSAAQQAGFGAGSQSGMQQQNALQAQLAQANNAGQMYQTALGNQNADALSNFWNAANTATNTANTSTGQAIGANQGAAGTYAQLYGSAPKTTAMSVLQPALAAGGQVGAAAACICEFTAVEMPDGSVCNVEELREGKYVKAMEGVCQIMGIEKTENVESYAIATRTGHFLKASGTHTLARKGGGYVLMKDAMAQEVRTRDGWDSVEQVREIGKQIVYKLLLSGSHTYLSGGVWSME